MVSGSDIRILNMIDLDRGDLETLRDLYDGICYELYLLRCERRKVEASLDDYDMDSEEYASYDSLLNNIIFLSGFADRVQAKIMHLENAAYKASSSGSADTDTPLTLDPAPDDELPF